MKIIKNLLVAQSDRAWVSEAQGRGFNSRQGGFYFTKGEKENFYKNCPKIRQKTTEGLVDRGNRVNLIV